MNLIRLLTVLALATPAVIGLVAADAAQAHDLAELDLLTDTLRRLDREYIDEARIDPQAMFEGALDGIERRAPSCHFRREAGASMLHVQVGDANTVIEAPRIASLRHLEIKLTEVSRFLVQHLDPADIPDVEPGEDPLAQVEHAMLNGALLTLDPHTMLLPPRARADLDAENEGRVGGIGVTITQRDHHVEVEYTTPGSPAATAGLRSGDRMVRIAGNPTRGLDLRGAARFLRGPIGEPVDVLIERPGVDEPLRLSIPREEVRLNPVEGTLLAGDIGYVVVPSFHETTSADLRDVVHDLGRRAGSDGLRGLVLDLRDNPGGFLKQAIAVADTFLDAGYIVSTINAHGTSITAPDRAGKEGTEPAYPLAVLVNVSSASASEIVAGALQANGRAIVVGERTFGKGSVQNLHPLEDMSVLKYTTHRYLIDGGHSVQARGIDPDVALVPIIARQSDADSQPEVALVWREYATREADLDAHLEAAPAGAAPAPAYTVAYLRPPDMRRRTTPELDPSGDREVGIAADILRSARGATTRETVLASGAAAVRRIARSEDDAIRRQLATLGIDWRDGPARDTAALDVALHLGPLADLVPGEPSEVTLTVTNTGKEPLYRVLGLASGPTDLLSHSEWPMGYLPPGESHAFSHSVTLPVGYPAETVPLTVTFRDGGGELTSWEGPIAVRERPLPRFGWHAHLVDASGDGVVQAGEQVRLDVDVTNLGTGPSVSAFATLRVGSGHAELGVSDLEPGVMAPGATWSGSLDVTPREGNVALRLTVGDYGVFDVGASRANLVTDAGDTQILRLAVGKPLPEVGGIQTPEIEITRLPSHGGSSGVVTVSGVVRDERGVARVSVLRNDAKVFLESKAATGPVRSVPFTADIVLEPGVTTVTVVAVDTDGTSTTRSVVTTLQDPVLTARASDP